MLESFVGTFDHRGLRSLRPEDPREDFDGRVVEPNGRFWAIIDTDNVSPIHEALVVGQRGAALDLLAQKAVSLGRFYR
jgi:hypothetical protein